MNEWLMLDQSFNKLDYKKVMYKMFPYFNHCFFRINLIDGVLNTLT